MADIDGKIKITVVARDQPGELIRILKPLSENGANIHGVFHDHDYDVEDGSELVPVEIIFTLSSNLTKEERDEKIQQIKSALIREKFQIKSLSMRPVKEKFHVILIGHIFDTDIRDSIVQISEIGAQVVDLKASIKSTEDISTVMLTVLYENEEIRKKLKDKIEDICRQKNLKYISS
ncbi:MAG: hypothetical protein ACTSWN_12955 [Promethearchaeota archaeon]